MGFFEKISRSPAEKKLAAHFKQQNQMAKAQLKPNQEILPQVMSAALELFKLSVATNSGWEGTLRALKGFKDVAKKANSAPDLRLAAQAHSLAYAKFLENFEPTNPRITTFENLKFHWYEVYEDLRDMYLAGKVINLDPRDIEEIVEVLSYIDNFIWMNCKGTSNYSKWQDSRKFHRKDFPVLPEI